MFSANQSRFHIQVSNVEPELSVLSFTGVEAISQPFKFEVMVVCEGQPLDLNQLLYQTALLTIAGSEAERYLHGQVTSATLGESQGRFTHYQLTLEPSFKLLSHRTGFRVFQQQTVEDIVKQLLKEAGILSDRYLWQLNDTYPPLPFCVQYHETEYDFITRLLAANGIHYHFEHSPQNHRLTFSDGQTGFKAPEEGGMAVFHASDSRYKTCDTISQFKVNHQVAPGEITLRDYNFVDPGMKLIQQHQSQGLAVPGDKALKHNIFPSPIAQGKNSTLAKRQLQALRRETCIAQGAGNIATFSAGCFFDLTEHYHPAWNQRWLTTSIEHVGKQPQVLEELAQDKAFYENTFTATPWDVFWRPKPIAKPVIAGVQSAVVTGPEGEEIYTDQYGRVKVKFHWDTQQYQYAGQSSAWLRVAQQWAGNGFGSFSLPRVGMEVLITFIHGDPDQPLITGCGYNGRNLPPQPLPAARTQTTLKTRSTPGGEGFNELRFDDRAGQEQIYLHSQRNLDLQIQNDSRTTINNHQHLKVIKDQYSETGGNHHQTIHGDSRQQIDQDLTQTITGSQQSRVGKVLYVEAGQEVHLKSGSKVVINAGAEITLNAGGSFVKIDPAGVHLSGAGINLNSGGSASAGTVLKAKEVILPVITADKALEKTTETPSDQTTHNSQVLDGIVTLSALEKATKLNSPAVKICAIDNKGEGQNSSAQKKDKFNQSIVDSTDNTSSSPAKPASAICKNTCIFPDERVRGLLQENNHDILLLNLSEAFAYLQSEGWKQTKETWVEITDSTLGQIMVNYGVNGKDVVTTSMIISRLGSLGIKATVDVNHLGHEIIKFSGWPNVRKILNAPRFKLNNPKVVDVGIGKYGLKNSIVSGARLTFYVAAAYRTVDFILRDETTLSRYIGSLATDAAKIGIASLVSWGAGVALSITPFVIAPLVAVVVSGLITAIFLNKMDTKFGITDQLVNYIEKSQQEVLETAKEIEDGFWDLGQMLVDGFLETGREITSPKVREYLKTSMNEITSRFYE